MTLPRSAELGDVITELTGRIAERTDTRVAADGFTTNKSRGRILIECADIEDLRRITDAITGK